MTRMDDQLEEDLDQITRRTGELEALVSQIDAPVAESHARALGESLKGIISGCQENGLCPHLGNREKSTWEAAVAKFRNLFSEDADTAALLAENIAERVQQLRKPVGRALGHPRLEGALFTGLDALSRALDELNETLRKHWNRGV